MHVAGVARHDVQCNEVRGGAGMTFDDGEGVSTWRCWPLGRELLQFDADVLGLARTAEFLSLRFTDGSPPHTIYLFSPSSSALQAICIPRSRTASAAALLFHRALTALTLRFHFQLVLCWSPVDDVLERQNTARTLALGASRLDPPDTADHHLRTASFQKKQARSAAFSRWATEWYRKRMNESFILSTTGFNTASHAYRYAIISPPDGANHPLWRMATDCKRDAKGRKLLTQPLYSRRTTSTAFQLATDHAFTGTYSQRFRPSDPAESRWCPCGRVVARSPTHLILHCPRHVQHRRNVGITGRYNPPALITLFSTTGGAKRLLQYLAVSGAAMRPEIGIASPPGTLPEPDVPPEPD